jgi:hypothetical protein
MIEENVVEKWRQNRNVSQVLGSFLSTTQNLFGLHVENYSFHAKMDKSQPWNKRARNSE